jgi:thioredoxin-related protein
MNLKKIFFIFLMAISLTSPGQEKQLYNIKADADKDISLAIARAGREKKFVLIQGGGNWCKWCIEFARFASADREISEIIDKNFVWYHLNYSTENKNENIFARYGYPQRFGFPVFIILDGEGKRIHTQNSEYLENGKNSYDAKKVKSFLEMWTPSALDPSTYPKGS